MNPCNQWSIRLTPWSHYEITLTNLLKCLESLELSVYLITPKRNLYDSMIIIYKPGTTSRRSEVQTVQSPRKQQQLQTFDDFSIYRKKHVKSRPRKKYQNELGDLNKCWRQHTYKVWSPVSPNHIVSSYPGGYVGSFQAKWTLYFCLGNCPKHPKCSTHNSCPNVPMADFSRILSHLLLSKAILVCILNLVTVTNHWDLPILLMCREERKPFKSSNFQVLKSVTRFKCFLFFWLWEVSWKQGDRSSHPKSSSIHLDFGCTMFEGNGLGWHVIWLHHGSIIPSLAGQRSST